jgi:Zn-dependent M28 family amino/carboxypeptidase
MARKAVFLFALFVPVAALLLSAQTAPQSALIDATQLLLDLKTLSADDLQGRQVGTPGGEKARAFVVARFKAAGIQPIGTSYEVPFKFSGRGANAAEREGVNVVGTIEGSRMPRRYIVVSAHYDHIGVRNGEVFNGADDNASGTAALFAIAKYFSTHKTTNSLLFAAFDAEETGLRGSQAFVKNPPVDAASISIDLNGDMIGRDPNDKLFVVGTALQPYLNTHVEAIAGKAPLKLLIGHEDPKQPEDWTRDSDHYSFIQAKIPALYFGVEDFDQHHKATDDYETMTYPFYVKAVETLIQSVQYFDAHLNEVDQARKSAGRAIQR